MPQKIRNNIVVATIDDLDEKYRIRGSKILVRIDINSPIDPLARKILDDTRIRAHSQTVKELAERGAAVVLMSHQGRPGDSDYVSLEPHKELLEKYTGIPIKFVDDVIGPAAREAIRNTQPGEVLLLDNTRLAAEEIIEALPQSHMKSIFVQRLAPLVNFYINDAFAAAHRSQPSIVGFPLLMPSAAGRVMEKELLALSKLYNSEERPRVYVLGGGKVHDTLRILEHLHHQRSVERILSGGLVAELFLIAKGIDLGKQNTEILEKKGVISLIPRARRLLLRGLPLETPIDFLTLHRGEVKAESIGSIKGVIRDIGPETIKMYAELLRDAKTVVLRGPMGVVEDPRFRRGSSELIKAAANTDAFVIVGGGHLNAIASNLDEKSRNKLHISTGGGALLLFLAGEDLPGITTLVESYNKFFLEKTSTG